MALKLRTDRAGRRDQSPQGLALDLWGGAHQNLCEALSSTAIKRLSAALASAAREAGRATPNSAKRWRRAADRLRRHWALAISVPSRLLRKRHPGGTLRAQCVEKPVRISPPVWKPDGFQTVRNRAVWMDGRREMVPLTDVSAEKWILRLSSRCARRPKGQEQDLGALPQTPPGA